MNQCCQIFYRILYQILDLIKFITLNQQNSHNFQENDLDFF